MTKRQFLLPTLLAIFMMTGCASTGNQVNKVERMTPEQLAKILPTPVAVVPFSKATN